MTPIERVSIYKSTSTTMSFEPTMNKETETILKPHLPPPNPPKPLVILLFLENQKK
jgi:hypothetical protein